MLLVAAAIVSVGLTELYFTYQDSKRAVTRVERDKAAAAATAIEQRMQEFLRTLDAVAQPTRNRSGGSGRTDTRTSAGSSSGTSSITRLTYVDSTGRSRSAHLAARDRPQRSPESTLYEAAAFVRAGRSSGISGASTSSAAPGRT